MTTKKYLKMLHVVIYDGIFQWFSHHKNVNIYIIKYIVYTYIMLLLIYFNVLKQIKGVEKLLKPTYIL